MRSEAELIRLLQRRFRAGGGVRVGIGDDAAVLAPTLSGRDWVVTTDLLVEGVHFQRAAQPARAVGGKALARSLSDVAAMGARPRYALVALAVPADTAASWVDGFFAGVQALASRHRVKVVGGDLSSASQVVVDVQVLGEVETGRAWRRSGARPGEVIVVSGTLGLSHLGLAALRRGRAAHFRAAVRFHLYPQPRLQLAAALRRRVRVGAMIDLSDGLSTDLAHLCEASRVGARLWAERVPVVKLPRSWERRLGVSGWELALNGGEDYELLFTVPKSAAARLPRKLAGVKLTAIGEIISGSGIRLVDAGGKQRRLAPRGWDHFRPGSRPYLRKN